MIHMDYEPRLREFGIPVKEIDVLDEQTLSLEQIRKVMLCFCSVSLHSHSHAHTHTH
jgi:hypothetical protein